MAIAEVQSHETTLKPRNIRVNLWRPGPLVLLVPALASIGAVSIYPVFLVCGSRFETPPSRHEPIHLSGLTITSSSFPTASFGTPGSTRSSLPPRRHWWRPR